MVAVACGAWRRTVAWRVLRLQGTPCSGAPNDRVESSLKAAQPDMEKTLTHTYNQELTYTLSLIDTHIHTHTHTHTHTQICILAHLIHL